MVLNTIQLINQSINPKTLKKRKTCNMKRDNAKVTWLIGNRCSLHIIRGRTKEIKKKRVLHSGLLSLTRTHLSFRPL